MGAVWEKVLFVTFWMILSFQLKMVKWTMPSSAIISNLDISINVGYHQINVIKLMNKQ